VYHIHWPHLYAIPMMASGVLISIAGNVPVLLLTEWHQVIETAGSIPVLVRGGGRATDEEILNRTYGLMEQGAKGIVYGRNVIQHANPAGMTKALMSIVHEGASPDEVIELLREKATV
jgi:class I fructose-bisphosphate aldolase